jgi:hypothetical protein
LDRDPGGPIARAVDLAYESRSPMPYGFTAPDRISCSPATSSSTKVNATSFPLRFSVYQRGLRAGKISRTEPDDPRWRIGGERGNFDP